MAIDAWNTTGMVTREMREMCRQPADAGLFIDLTGVREPLEIASSTATAA